MREGIGISALWTLGAGGGGFGGLRGVCEKKMASWSISNRITALQLRGGRWRRSAVSGVPRRGVRGVVRLYEGRIGRFGRAEGAGIGWRGVMRGWVRGDRVVVCSVAEG